MGNFLDDYEPVETRIRSFWTEHPEGRIVTELVAHSDGDYIFRAEVFKLPPVTGASMTGGVQLPDATGYAHDSAAQLPSNMKASALEVCETSAIGRALANLGYAAKGKRPSREEMSKSPRVEPEPSSGSARATSEEVEAHTGGSTKHGHGTTSSETPEGVGERETIAYGEGVTAPSDPAPSVEKPKCAHPEDKRIPSPVARMKALGWTVCTLCNTALPPVAVSA